MAVIVILFLLRSIYCCVKQCYVVYAGYRKRRVSGIISQYIDIYILYICISICIVRFDTIPIDCIVR